MHSNVLEIDSPNLICAGTICKSRPAISKLQNMGISVNGKPIALIDTKVASLYGPNAGSTAKIVVSGV